MSGLACVAQWRGGGRKARKRGKGRELLPSPLSPTPLPFLLFPYPHTPFDICYAGYESTRETLGLVVFHI